jgi:hypothetical protein
VAQVVKQTKPDALTVSETWFDASKFFLGDEFDSTMNYIFRDAVLAYANGGDAHKLMVANLEEMREAYPPQTFSALMNLLSTHDTARSLHLFGDVDGKATPEQVALAKQKLRLAVFFQMTYPGSPAIFYGDEVGVTGGPDPMNRGTYPWADRGGHPDNALLADFQRLTLRRDLPVLRHGTLLAPLHVDAHVVVLARRDGDDLGHHGHQQRRRAADADDRPARRAPATGWVDASDARRRARRTPAAHLTLVVPARFGIVLAKRAPALSVRARLRHELGRRRRPLLQSAIRRSAPCRCRAASRWWSSTTCCSIPTASSSGPWPRVPAAAPFPYPGLVIGAPAGLAARFADFFAQHARTRLQARRTLSHDVRLSMVTTPPEQLDPRQWQCHRDRGQPRSRVDVRRVGAVPVPRSGPRRHELLRAAPVAGRHRPHPVRQPDAERRAVHGALRPAPGYMDGSNAYFDCVARVPAAWNRMILYDAGFFHSGDIGHPDLLTTDPATARLTLNGFFTCRRQAG